MSNDNFKNTNLFKETDKHIRQFDYKYWDTFDEYKKAIENIHTILQNKGRFYFSVPIGPQRIEYNAHRVFSLTYLFEYLSTYFASQGIRVNCISPGPILENQPDYLIQNLINRIPMGKLAHTKDIVGAIQFLLDDTSSYITGQNIVVDGGRTTW